MKKTRQSRTVARFDGSKPTPSGQLILDLLTRYRYLSTHHIAALTVLGHRYTQDLLRSLYDGGHVLKPEASRYRANDKYKPDIYELAKNRPLSEHQLPHELLVCLIRASFELGAMETGVEVVTQQQMLTHPNCPEGVDATIPLGDFTLKPDAMLGVKGNKSIFFFLEADRSSEPLDVKRGKDTTRAHIRQKMRAYNEIAVTRIYKKRYGLPNFFVPIVTISEDRMTHMMAMAREFQASDIFLFKTMDDPRGAERFPKPDGSMLLTPWKTVHGEFNIMEAINGRAAATDTRPHQPAREDRPGA